ncbi:tyrosine-type recombinase/integrase [Candidatus Woesearchaeota archaeon]|nr:tyrosine-type recombinase/integrase [Candidatus Woesearchaeota archaeon]
MKNEEVSQKVERELQLLGHSQRTINSYLNYLNELFKFTGKSHSRILFEDIKQFLDHLSIEKNYSGSSLNLARSAISFYYEKILEKYTVSKIRIKKVGKKLPVVLTKQEVRKIIDSTSNLRDKLIVQTMYSCGLRVSEAVNMKLEDLDMANLTGMVKSGKGNKDRMIQLNRMLVSSMEDYLKTKKNNSPYLFSKNNGNHYTIRSFQLIIKKIAKNAGITKRVYSHIFRHAYGTHLVEDGLDIVRVQGLMGHESLETTKLYINLSKEQFKGVKNPLESLYEDEDKK